MFTVTQQLKSQYHKGKVVTRLCSCAHVSLLTFYFPIVINIKHLFNVIRLEGL